MRQPTMTPTWLKNARASVASDHPRFSADTFTSNLHRDPAKSLRN